LTEGLQGLTLRDLVLRCRDKESEIAVLPERED